MTTSATTAPRWYAWRPSSTWLREVARSLALPVSGGVVAAFCIPPTDFYPAIVIGLAMLAASVPSARTHWRAFGRGVDQLGVHELAGAQVHAVLVLALAP